MERFLKTADGKDISYNYVEANSEKAVILIHQFRRDKSSYEDFAKKLKENGFSSIAIDLRGHGKSSGKWQDFSDDDFRAMKNDVLAAKKFLEEKNKTKIFIVGASIGANTALNFAAENQEIRGIVLLSPGIEYHGINVEDSILKNKVPVYIFAGKGDFYALESSQKIYAGLKSKKELKIFDGNSHGTDMFNGTEMEKLILNWLKEN
jgi:alpha-beta hydrolase superfamily lysophospholipase